MMFDLLGGMLSSAPGGDTDEGDEDPQEDASPELEYEPVDGDGTLWEVDDEEIREA